MILSTGLFKTADSFKNETPLLCIAQGHATILLLLCLELFQMAEQKID